MNVHFVALQPVMSETTGLLVAVSKIAGEVGERDPGFRRPGVEGGRDSWKLPGERQNTALG
jgi:hypothetical protein